MQDLFRDLEAFTIAAAISLGLRLETGAVHAAGQPHHQPVAPPSHVVASPRRTASWMDYIDFRRGSGDVLRWVDSSMMTDEARTCGE